jgi:short-subunit dehydrogenase
MPVEPRAEAGRRTALVTGASGGIGAELAQVLAAGGHDLVLVARSEGRLRAFAEDLGRAHRVNAIALAADLSRIEEVERVARAASSQAGAIEVLVNNAGFGLHGAFASTDAARELEMIQLNIVALTRLSKAFLPDMISRGRGRILNVASTAGFVPGPFMAVYYATKAYVVSLSLALAEEVRGTGVTVTCLAPGATRTGFAEGAGMIHSRLFRSRLVMAAPEVARAGYQGMMAGRRLVIPGAVNRLMIESGRLAPRGLLARITRFLQDPEHMQ